MNTLIAGIFIIPLYIIGYALILGVPTFLLVKMYHAWIEYIQERTFFKQTYALFELKLPKEVARSPVGMEIFFASLFQTAAPTYHETYWQGRIRPTFSLELVSIEGKVHFYIYCQKKYRNQIESQIYAQYPTVEIFEVEDYTRNVQHDPSTINLWGTQFLYTKPNAFPIKSYIDYGLDKEQEEEFKIDPMTSVLEYLGSLKPGEQTWIQIIIQAHKKINRKAGKLVGEAIPDWQDGIKKEIKKIREQGVLGEGDHPRFPNPTKGESETIAAMERHMAKMAFDVVIRGFYISKKEIFNAGLGLTGLIGSFRQYNSITNNGFKINNNFTDFDDTGKDILTLFGWIWPIADIGRWMRDGMEKQMLNLYKWRYAFLEPHHRYNPVPMVMSTETLATIFHFPGQVATTPTMARTMSKKAEPPPNLPI